MASAMYKAQAQTWNLDAWADILALIKMNNFSIYMSLTKRTFRAAYVFRIRVIEKHQRWMRNFPEILF